MSLQLSEIDSEYEKFSRPDQEMISVYEAAKLYRFFVGGYSVGRSHLVYTTDPITVKGWYWVKHEDGREYVDFLTPEFTNTGEMMWAGPFPNAKENSK